MGAMEHPRYTDFRVLTISVITRLQCIWMKMVTNNILVQLISRKVIDK